MKNKLDLVLGLLKTVIGCALFGLGFSLFLQPNGLNTGGITGLSMVIYELVKAGSVGMISALINLPLFVIGGVKVGRKFFFGSLLGMILLSVFIDLFAAIPAPVTEPVMGALYGGALCGLGLGLVFSSGFSTGGSDIIVRLLKKKFQYIPIGVINTIFDACVAVLTAIVFRNINQALYCGIAVFVTGRVVDAVVYGFDYSKVALIITKKHEEVAYRIGKELHRGSTFLKGEGSYSHKDTKVVLTAVKMQQIAEMKQIVVDIDPDAFIIVQDAHQVLGDGFTKYSKDAL